MTPDIHRAGSVVGLPPLLAGQAMRVGLLVGWTMAVAAALDPRPRQRPVGSYWVAVSLAMGLLGLLLRGVEGLLVGVVVGASVFFVMIMVLGFTIESVLFRQADRVWLLTSPAGQACAKVTVTKDGAWHLTSVAAWPFKRQLGTHLIGEICRDADAEGCEIVLKAQNPRVAALYNRHHFVDDPGRDRLAMKRLPTSVSDGVSLRRAEHPDSRRHPKSSAAG